MVNKMKKIKKRLIALGAVCIMAASAISLNLFRVDAAQEFSLADNFSDSKHTKNMWSPDLSGKVENGTLKLAEATEKYLVSDSIWDEGNKPTKFSFTAYTADSDKESADGGLAVQLLSAGDTNVVLTLNTTQQYQYHKLTTGNFTYATNNEIESNGRIWQTGFGGAKNVQVPVTYTASYDWSKWDTDGIVTITVTRQLNGNSAKAVIVCTYGGNAKPETFKVGFQNQNTKRGVLTHMVDDVSVEYKVSETKLIQLTNERYEAFEKNKSYEKANAFMQIYKTLADTSKNEVAANYKKVCAWLQAQAGAYTDNFNNADKTETMWTNRFVDLVSDEKIVLDGVTDAYLISDEMWADGNKPSKLSFTAYTSKSSIDWPDAGLDVQVLSSADVNLVFGINTAQGQGFHRFDASEVMTIKSVDGQDYSKLPSDKIDGQKRVKLMKDMTAAGSNKTIPIPYTFTYDWSKWDEVAEGQKPQVTITITADFTANGGIKKKDVVVFECNAKTKPETFKVGFAGGRSGEASTVDDVTVEYRVSEEKLKEQVAAKYDDFVNGKSYALANTFLTAYKTLTSTNQTALKNEYDAVCTWVKTQSGGLSDDFSDKNKTNILWTNGLVDKVTDDESATLAGATEKYLISDDVWETGKKPVRFSFTTYTDTTVESGKWPDNGLAVQLLAFGDSNVAVTMNTGQSYQYHKVTTKDFTFEEAHEIQKNGRLWQTTFGTLANVKAPVTYTFTYDWSDWDTNKAVTITAIREYEGVTAKADIKCTYTGEGQPDTFKVGFQNQALSQVIDNVKISDKFEPVILGAAATVNQDDEVTIQVQSDFTIIQGIKSMSGGSLKEFGVIAVPGTKTNAEVQTVLKKMVEGNVTEDADTGSVRQTVNAEPGNWTGIINVTIDNSGKESNIAKRMTAMAYMVFEKDGKMQYYCSSNDSELVKDGVVTMSAIGIIKTALNENSDLELQGALDKYNQTHSKSVTLESLKTVISGTGRTSKDDRTLLQEVFKHLYE